MDKERKINLIVLSMSSIILLLSIFWFSFYSLKFMGLGFIQYIIVIGYIMNKTIFQSVKPKEMSNYLDEKSEELLKDKKYGPAILHMSIFPFIGVGLSFVLIAVFIMFI